MAAGPAPKRKPLAAVPANDAGQAKRTVAAPANDNRPNWLRWIGGAVLIAIGIAVLFYFTRR